MKKIGQISGIAVVMFASLLAITSTNGHTAGSDAVAVELSRLGISNPPAGTHNAGGMTPELAEQKVEEELERSRALVLSQFCDQPPAHELCATLPHDNTDFSSLFVYIFLSAAAQNSFDIFSWQSFIALNWPMDDDGNPQSTLTPDGTHTPRWADYITPQELFAPDKQNSACGDNRHNTQFTLTTSNFLQPTGHPLIDQNLNYVVYDVRVNPIMANYMREHELDSVDGQTRFMQANKTFDFPVGKYDNPVTKTGGQPGSVAVKTAWKIIDTEKGDKPARFFTLNGNIDVPATMSESGEALCIEARLGLVGMHIMHRTESGNGKEWIWSTFEHIDNAPLASNSRRPNDVLHESPFEDGCLGPKKTVPRKTGPKKTGPKTTGAMKAGYQYSLKEFSFYDASCDDCQSNSLPDNRWTWSADAPYTGQYAARGGKPTQVVQCWDVFEGTQLVNNEWQKKLQNTVWANYRSVSAQWKGANRGKMVPEGEVPRFMTNTTLETYEQHKPRGSCMSCHASARSAAGQNTGFSFLPSLVSRYQ